MIDSAANVFGYGIDEVSIAELMEVEGIWSAQRTTSEGIYSVASITDDRPIEENP
ncbi:MAG: hypothetical protein WCC87_18105 [Candidatus Korobacteraceae bacterium]